MASLQTRMEFVPSQTLVAPPSSTAAAAAAVAATSATSAATASATPAPAGATATAPTATNNGRQRAPRRRRGGGKPTTTRQQSTTATSSEGAAEDNNRATSDDVDASSQQQQQQHQQRRQQQQQQHQKRELRPHRPKREGNTTSTEGGINNSKPRHREQQRNSDNDKKKSVGSKNRRNNNNSKNNRNNNNNNNKRFPWRKFIPPGTVDPITLDPLEDIPYPPFALMANEPYEPVPEWPPKEDEEKAEAAIVDPVAAAEERQRRILEEQWGEKLKLKEETAAAATTATSATGPRHYNLYDGRALAYYLVSQLQFIDPLNRRDLTRDELINLDQYLRRHGLDQAGVVEAYDAKGITISTAGAAATTAAGRAEILQQQAAQLLQALFGGGVGVISGTNNNSNSNSRSRGNRSSSRNTTMNTTAATNNNSNSSTAAAAAAVGSNRNLFQQQYASHEQRHQQQNIQRSTLNPLADAYDETAFYGDHGGGMFIIDDDMNPRLRGAGIPEMAAAAAEDAQNAGQNSTLWSASHIRSRIGATTLALRPDNFPALSAVSSDAPLTATATNAATEAPASSEGPPSKSLLKIVKAVKKTNPEELQRQRDAREEALRRAMMSNLSFGADTTAMNGWTNTMTTIPTTAPADEASGPTEGQLQRNKALAEALGVKPVTVRSNSSLFSGWARPSDGKIELDEYGNELNVAIYPDSLIQQARERIGPLLKLERKWKTFLASDTAASLPLQPMDKAMRAFVHEYSDFWKLKTESFDPEPRRYIHCVKVRETCAPIPLLSEAVRNWKGPTLTPPLSLAGPVLSSPPLYTSTAGAPIQGGAMNSLPAREFPPPPERIPLPLKPRSVNPTTEDGTPSVPPPPRRMDSGSDEMPSTTRFDALFTGRERPKLTLTPRTRPLELPPYQPPAGGSSAAGVKGLGEAYQEKLAARARKEQQEEDKKKRILEAEFASSDEDAASASSSEWEEEEPLYPGSDGE